MAPAVATAAEHAENLRQLGKTFFAKSKFRAAIDAYIEAITLCPKVVVYRTNQALYFRKQDDWTKVEEDCRKALELDSSSFKERQLGEMNKHLKSKLEAGQGPFTTIQGTWNAGAIVGNNTFSVHPSQSTTMDCEPTTLHIGYHNFVSAEANLARSSENNFNQGWIL